MKLPQIIDIVTICIVFAGCSTVTPDNPINVERPAKTVQKKVSDIKSESSEARGKVKELGIKQLKSDSIISDLDEIDILADEVIAEAKKIENKQSDIENVAAELQSATDKQEQERKRIMFMLQIAGLIVGGLGVGAGFYLGRPKLGAGVAVAGVAVTLLSKFWAMYSTYLMIGLAILIVASVCYIAYLAHEHRRAVAKMLFNLDDDKNTKKIKDEVKQKGK